MDRRPAPKPLSPRAGRLALWLLGAAMALAAAGAIGGVAWDLLADQVRLKRSQWECRRVGGSWQSGGRGGGGRRWVEECVLWERRAPDGPGG